MDRFYKLGLYLQMKYFSSKKKNCLFIRESSKLAISCIKPNKVLFFSKQKRKDQCQKGKINFYFIDILDVIFLKRIYDRFYFVSKDYMQSIDLFFLRNNFRKWNHKYKCMLKILGSNKIE